MRKHYRITITNQFSILQQRLIEDGKPRKIDDFQPRANIRSQFAEGKLKDLTSITTFSTKFIVEESLVKDYLEHLQNLDLRKQVRTRTAQRKRQAEREKSL